VVVRAPCERREQQIERWRRKSFSAMTFQARTRGGWGQAAAGRVVGP
jgi:hypothetical protein